MGTIFAAFGKTLGNNKGSVQNFGIVGITIATEELGKFIFFYCPCDYPSNKMYGSIFMWGPAVCLLIVGYLANRRTWKLTTGLFNRTQGVGKGGKRIFHFLFIFSSIGMKAMIAPATWIVLAFLQGDYYACAHWPNPEDKTVRKHHGLPESNDTIPIPCLFNPNPAKFKSTSEAEVIARNLRAESHVIGWMIITIGMLLAVTGMFTLRCKSNFSYEQSNYIDRYRTHEIELFEAKLDERAKEQAQRIVDGYFSKPRAKEDWDRIAVINDKVTRSKRGKAIYSPLHKFVNKEFREAEELQNGDLVQDAAMKSKHKVPKKKPTSEPADNIFQAGSGTALPMMPIVSTGKQTTKIIQVAPSINETKPVHADIPPKSEEAVLHVEDSSKQQTAEKAKPTSVATPLKEIENEPAHSGETDPTTSPSSFPFRSEINEKPTLSPRKRPISLPPTTDIQLEQPGIQETSLGDLGGYYSREDLRKHEEVIAASQENIPKVLVVSEDAPCSEENDEEIISQNSDQIPLLEE